MPGWRAPAAAACKDLKSIAVIGPVAEGPAALLAITAARPRMRSRRWRGSGGRSRPRRQSTRRRAVSWPRARGRRCGSRPPLCARPWAARARRHGLLGTYSRGPGGLAGAAGFARIDHTVDFGWRDMSPLGGPVFEHFLACWEGALIAPVSGRYCSGCGGRAATAAAGWARAAALQL